MSTRGGQRPGAGAPRGNRNAVRSGKYVSDPDLRRAFRHAQQSLPPEDYDALVRGYKASEVETMRRPSIESDPSDAMPRHRPSITPTAQPSSGQSNPYSGLIGRLEQYDFRGAAAFVRVHHAFVSAIEDAIRYLDELDDEDFRCITNPGGFIRADAHRAIGVPRGHVLVCPACRWSEPITSTDDAEPGVSERVR